MRIVSLSAIALFAGSAFGSASTINGVNVVPRIFNDFTTSTLNITNNYPASVRIQESDYTDDGIGGNFANRHTAYFSDDGGASGFDYNYDDGFYMNLTMKDSSTGIGNVEAGFQADLFGFGFFGALAGNGEIAAFGSNLPFKSFGAGLYVPGDTLDLAMLYRPNPGGEFSSPPGTIEYRYQINGGGWVSSGEIPFGNGEGGIPSGGFTQLLGFGAQLDFPIGGTTDVLFSNIHAVPAPGAMGLLGLASLAGLRRRR